MSTYLKNLRKSLFTVCLIILPIIWFFKNNVGDYSAESRDWEQSADERIEHFRKGDLTIICNLPEAERIELRQLKHDFSFGTAVQASMILDTTPNGIKYRNILKKYFNEVVFENDLKWQNWKDDKNGRYDKSQTLKAIQWLTDNKIKIRGHCLAWCPLQPYDKFNGIISEAIYKDAEKYENALFNHIDQILTATESTIFEWDLLNHPVTRSQYFQVSNNQGKMLLTDYLGKNINDELFRRVRDKNNSLKLFVNEDHILTYKADKKNVYFDFIQKLISKGHKPDGIGFMGHFNSDDLPKIEHIEKTLNHFSSFKIPLKVTEFDVLFGEMNQNYVLNDKEIKLQADFTRDFMKICFSNPTIEGFLFWGFWEKAHWYPSASLWGENWNIKPNGKMFINQTMNSWWSHVKHKIDNQGQFTTRLFFGTYKLEIYNRSGKLIRQKLYHFSKQNKKCTLYLSEL